MSPFKSMLGVVSFELDNDLGLKHNINDSPVIGDELERNISNLPRKVIGLENKSRDRAERKSNSKSKKWSMNNGRVYLYTTLKFN